MRPFVSDDIVAYRIIPVRAVLAGSTYPHA